MGNEGLQEFLAVASEFHLGELPTEKPHPLTVKLSDLAKQNPNEALRIFHTLDCHALHVVSANLPLLENMAQRIGEVLASGGTVFLTGCGSTGRLSLACESLWRKEKAGTPWEDRVKGFMAGGDIAMIRSVESFEDHPEYGARQLMELGFREGDILIASTEGGETPFVIGAVLQAAELSSRKSFFLYCNPDEILGRVAARSAAVLADVRIEKISLVTGPMALSGSTRLQASTVLMAAVGGALLSYGNPKLFGSWLEELRGFWDNLSTSFLAPFVEAESEAYTQGGHLHYVSDPELAITILTDTTERAPTFSMNPFVNDQEPSAPPCLCSLTLPSAPDRGTAWRLLLGRPPRGLEWEHLGKIASGERLMGFDFSIARLSDLEREQPHRKKFDIRLMPQGVALEMGGIQTLIPIQDMPMLSIHLVLKMLLNAHSTLVMGRLGRFDGNVMTWVKPSNHKLVDRTIRYTTHILNAQGITRSYEEIAGMCFSLRGKIPPDRSLISAMVEALALK